MSIPQVALSKSPSKSAASETSPVESPDSKRLIGSILTRPILPAPLWFTSSFLGVDDPVRIQSPRPPPALSTACRTVSHILGASCHSSMT